MYLKKLALVVVWLVSNMVVSFKRQELLTLREHLGSSPVFHGVRVAHRSSFLSCVGFFFGFLGGLHLVYLMLPVSLDYTFLFALSVFSNVY